MSLNLTLFGQIITFSIFIWFTMKFVWPPIIKAIHDRQKQIADGLAAAERGHKELELAQHKSTEVIREAKLQASHTIEQAHLRSVQIIEEAKEKARVEGQHIINRAQADVEQMVLSAREGLRKEVSMLVVTGAEKILEKEVDQTSHDKFFEELVNEL